MEDEPVTPRRRCRLAAALLGVAAIAVALPVSGALAGDEDRGSGTSSDAQGAPGFVQDRQEGSQERRDGRDCPEDKDGERGGGEGSSNQGSDETTRL